MLAVLTIIALFVAIFDGALTIVIAVRQRHDEAVDQRHWENQARFDEVITQLEQIQTGELAELLEFIKTPPRFVTDSEGRTYDVVHPGQIEVRR